MNGTKAHSVRKPMDWLWKIQLEFELFGVASLPLGVVFRPRQRLASRHTRRDDFQDLWLREAPASNAGNAKEMYRGQQMWHCTPIQPLHYLILEIFKSV